MVNLCPICNKGEIKEQIDYKNKFFGNKLKIITAYCNICGFKRNNEFMISNESYEIELHERLNKPQDKRIIHITDKNGK